ncbi:hypothetical protein BDR03DRAFT_400618 [Suillus americanus]|nr:hypothetical protein BDR03DRAFT_400618 [Suillus americanus]
MTVISKLLCSSPSPQMIANCSLLACVMVGVQFDKKDIVRVDKSSALPQLAESLWTQFQKLLWASDAGGLNNAVRPARHFDVICRALDRNLLPPPEMWNLVLRKVRCFRFAIDTESIPIGPCRPCLVVAASNLVARQFPLASGLPQRCLFQQPCLRLHDFL